MATQTALISNRESWGRIHVSGSIAIYSTVQSSTARALPNDRDTELVVCINELVRNAPLFNSSNRMFVMHSTKLNKMKECECLCTCARACSSMKKESGAERNPSGISARPAVPSHNSETYGDGASRPHHFDFESRLQLRPLDPGVVLLYYPVS
jgi:hypothetical protein